MALEEVAVADVEVVRMLMERLVKTFEQFATEQVALDPSGVGLTYIDALMGCHNFYKRIILDLESRMPGEGKSIVRRIAVDTLTKAMEDQKPYSR
jgi:hypothetical protein